MTHGLLPSLALFGVLVLVQHQLPTHPTDPLHIAATIGLSGAEFRHARCARMHSPAAPAGAPETLNCGPGEGAFRRLVAEGGSWSVHSDTSGKLYSGHRSWSRPRDRVAPLLDSVARALNARGLIHLSCPDSVQRPMPGDTRWLSVWLGPAFQTLLVHRVIDADSAQVTLQVSAGLHGQCYHTS
ncbi:MAG: hypothetical protein ABI877_07025 [Gemmatimonadaceae bacterium]